MALAIAVDIGINKDDGTTGHELVVAWLNGRDPCDSGQAHSLGVYVPDNPCSRPFTIGGIIGSLTWEGCGGDTWINQNGQFVGTCRYAPKKNSCFDGKGFEGLYICELQ